MYNTRFTTDTEHNHDNESFGLPQECYNELGTSCNIQIYGIKTSTTDHWMFYITGDIGELLSYKTNDSDYHYFILGT